MHLTDEAEVTVMIDQSHDEMDLVEAVQEPVFVRYLHIHFIPAQYLNEVGNRMIWC